MVLSHGNAHSHTAKMEQIITEFFAKTLHIILESRALSASSRNSYGGGDRSDSSPCSSSSPSPSVRPRDKWFNLALRECPAALVNINNLECLIIDVILVHRSLDFDPMTPKRVLPRSSSRKERYPLCYIREEVGVDAKSEKIVERWVVQYENRKIKDSNSGTRRWSNFLLQNLYKKLTNMLRSLYAKVRLLPAYKIFKDLSSSAEIRPFTLAHCVSSFVEPFTLKEESEMMKYRFTPVDTSSGRLCLEVMYCPLTSNLIGYPLSLFSRVIPDYVGSPLADPSRKLPLFPLEGVPCHGSPSARRHSSNFDDCKASSTSITDPSLPKSHVSVSNSSSCIFPPGSLAPSIQKNGASIDDGFNPSPSPSTYYTCSSSSTTLLGSEAVNSSGYTDRSTNVMQSGATAEKVFSLGKVESLRRSLISSRSYRNDFDGTDISCPFDVDYDDMKGTGSRKSNDAAVGTLVDMLKKARPLHQDLYSSKHHSLHCVGMRRPAIPTLRANLTTKPNDVSIGSRKTTRDALEEYEDYLEIKKWLVSKPQI
ncbi:autophagy-related protein 13b-like [Vicia villosa]|uniref:autophagy-related protein 13b-like n=1 Tax=Vicia villosa TaxID=3911 RepID=UPI00273C79A1|nr:autophagy-related protein 13b-like [Vicia villosa]